MTITDIVDYLLKADTSELIVDLADSIIENPNRIESFPHAIGIIVLAVDDAKTSANPASQNALYISTFWFAKRRLQQSI